MSIIAKRVGFNVEPGLDDPVVGGLLFTPTWTFRNAGTAAWRTDFTVRFDSGVGGTTDVNGQIRKHAQLAPKASYTFAELGITEPIEPEQVLSVTIPDMQTPDEAGDYISHWQLFTADGERLGPRRWVSPTVMAQVEPDDTSSDPPADKETEESQPGNLLPTPPIDNEPTEPVEEEWNEIGADAVGMTLSHFEFDIHQIDEDGNPNPAIQVTGGVQMTYPQLLGEFNVLRFMNWQKTNVTNEFHPPFPTLGAFDEQEENMSWLKEQHDEHEKPRDLFAPPWVGLKAVPLRVCLALAKKMESHPWVNIPHGESLDDYKQIMKRIVDITFEALAGTGLTPIFEFSNEIWNKGRFDQHEACAELAKKASQAGQFEMAGLNEFDIALAWQAMCTTLLKEEVGDRGYVVLGVQANEPDIAARLLNIPNDNGLQLFGDGKLGKHSQAINVDAIAVAPYFGNPRGQGHPKMARERFPNGFHPLVHIGTDTKITPATDDATIQALHDNLMMYVDGESFGGETREMMRRHRIVVNRFNELNEARLERPLQLWTYEAGPDLNPVKSDETLGFKKKDVKALYNAYLHDARSKQLMQRVLDLWRSDEVQGGLFVGYSSKTSYGIGDHFGYIDVANSDVPGVMTYVATPRLAALLNQE